MKQFLQKQKSIMMKSIILMKFKKSSLLKNKIILKFINRIKNLELQVQNNMFNNKQLINFKAKINNNLEKRKNVK